MSVSKTYCTVFGTHPVPANTTGEDFQAKCEALVESFLVLPVAQQNFLKFDIVKSYTTSLWRQAVHVASTMVPASSLQTWAPNWTLESHITCPSKIFNLPDILHPSRSWLWYLNARQGNVYLFYASLMFLSVGQTFNEIAKIANDLGAQTLIAKAMKDFGFQINSVVFSADVKNKLTRPTA
ncbi:hypothetical protein B0H14DRAFT_2632044 [Mycena olivaceomarginata]|nr:hypothetical protein B0H14DRAFT_2632044 [Mycena olivaceomarginata]